MKFSLDEIRQLIDQQSLTDLKLLKRDLTELLNACVASSQDEECPIIGGIKKLD